MTSVDNVRVFGPFRIGKKSPSVFFGDCINSRTKIFSGHTFGSIKTSNSFAFTSILNDTNFNVDTSQSFLTSLCKLIFDLSVIGVFSVMKSVICSTVAVGSKREIQMAFSNFGFCSRF